MKVLSITLLILPFYAVPIALVERIVEIPMWDCSQAASGLIEPHNWRYLLVGGLGVLAAEIALCLDLLQLLTAELECRLPSVLWQSRYWRLGSFCIAMQAALSHFLTRTQQLMEYH